MSPDTETTSRPIQDSDRGLEERFQQPDFEQSKSWPEIVVICTVVSELRGASGGGVRDESNVNPTRQLNNDLLVVLCRLLTVPQSASVPASGLDSRYAQAYYVSSLRSSESWSEAPSS